MDKLHFYFRNAVLSLLRERRRAVFAVFTVVVGVAAIVGLLLTADTLERAPTSSVRSLLQGDIAIIKKKLVDQAAEQAVTFTESESAGIQALLDEGVVEGYTVRGNPLGFADEARFKATVVGRTDKDAIVSLFTPVFFERNAFPYCGEVIANGRGLWELIQGDYDVLVTRNLANRHDIDVGDGLKLSGIDQPFAVKGILPLEALGRVGDPLKGNVV